MTQSPLQFSIEDAIATIAFDNDARRNAMGPRMLAAFDAALDAAVKRRDEVRVLVLTGRGRAFCSGGDMAEAAEISNARRASGADGQNPGSHYTLGSHHHPVLRKLRELPFPIITALNGPAAGMGLGYALMGDLIVAKRSARLSARFVKVGMSPDAGASWLLPRLIGSARTREMLLLGDDVSAEQALAWGMINRVFDDGDFEAETQALAARLAAGPPLALNRVRQLCWDAWKNSHEEQIHNEEKRQQEMGLSQDALEGFTAFLEKRAPQFSGR
jgi:2-(1,2-epoxy-1,2-dihydrophenyl)acetyl-CoA isomerase